MKYREFGRTGLRASEVVFGGGWVGGILIHGDDDTRRAVIRLALDAGINWIDTAASYGEGKSETALGWLLAELPAADRPHISTKFGLDLARLDDIPGQIEASLTASLERLRMDRVTLFQLHNQLGPDGLAPEVVLAAGGVADTLDRLKDQGLFDHAGFTALGDPAACRQVIESGRFRSAQVYYNLLNPSAGHAVGATWSTADFDHLIDSAAEHGVAVMNIRIFAGGALASPVTHGREIPVTPNAEVELEGRRAAKLFEALGAGEAEWPGLAVRFGLSNPKVSCVVLGLAEIAHLKAALAAAAAGPLSAEQLARIAPFWQSDFA